MSSKTTESRRKKIDLTRRLIAILTDSLYQEKRAWDKVDKRRYARMVTQLEEMLKVVNPGFEVTIKRGDKI